MLPFLFVLAFFFLGFARLIALIVGMIILRMVGFMVILKFVVHVLFAGTNFVDAFFGGAFGHFSKFGFIFLAIGDIFFDGFTFGEAEKNFYYFFAQIFFRVLQKVFEIRCDIRPTDRVGQRCANECLRGDVACFRDVASKGYREL